MKTNMLLIPNPNSYALNNLSYDSVKRIRTAEDNSEYRVVNLNTIEWYAVVNKVFFEARIIYDGRNLLLIPGKRCLFESEDAFNFPEVLKAYKTTTPHAMCLDCGIQFSEKDNQYHIVEKKDFGLADRVLIPAEEIWSNPYEVTVPNFVRSRPNMPQNYYRRVYSQWFAENQLHARYADIYRAITLGAFYANKPSLTMQLDSRSLAVNELKNIDLYWHPRFGSMAGGNQDIQVRFRYENRHTMYKFADMIGI